MIHSFWLITFTNQGWELWPLGASEAWYNMDVRILSNPAVELPPGSALTISERVIGEQAETSEPAPAKTDPAARKCFKKLLRFNFIFAPPNISLID
jgi:hypothetical protein